MRNKSCNSKNSLSLPIISTITDASYEGINLTNSKSPFILSTYLWLFCTECSLGYIVMNQHKYFATVLCLHL